MKHFISFCFCIVVATMGFGQIVSPDSVAVSYIDSLNLWQEKTMARDGRLYSLVYFSDSSLTVQQGDETYFYSNGNIRCTSKYENGTIQGEVLSFYHDGRKKRIDVYETGKYQGGTCYGTSGGIIPHTDFKKDVAYPGGVQALYSIIIVNAQQLSLPNSETVTGLVSVRLSIDKNGKIVEKQIVKSLHPLYDAEILRICEHIGKFEPAERDGETVPGFYLLTVKY